MTLETVLAEHGVSKEDIEKALAFKAKAGGSLERILLNMGSFSEEALPSVYSQFLRAPVLQHDQRDSWSPPDLPDDFPLKFFQNDPQTVSK